MTEDGLREQKVMNYESLNNVICQSFVLEYGLDSRKRVRILLKRLSRQEKVILDAGSSTGNYLFTHGGQNRDFLCFDLSGPALRLLKQKAKKIGKSRISFVRADATRAPLRNEAFGGIIAGDIMEHLSHDVDFLSEMTRTLKPHGILVLSVPHGERLTPFDLRAGHVRRYTMSSLTTLIRKVGLIPVEAFYWGFPAMRLYGSMVSIILNKKGGEGFASKADTNFLRKLTNSWIFRFYLLLLPLLERISGIDEWLGGCEKGSWLILSATKVYCDEKVA